MKNLLLIPSCGTYDLTYLPIVPSDRRKTILSGPEMIGFIERAIPHNPITVGKKPQISPVYANLIGMPPALFLYGTEDPLIDDSMYMAMEWGHAGNTIELKLLPGAAQASTLFQGMKSRIRQWLT